MTAMYAEIDPGLGRAVADMLFPPTTTTGLGLRDAAGPADVLREYPPVCVLVEWVRVRLGESTTGTGWFSHPVGGIRRVLGTLVFPTTTSSRLSGGGQAGLPAGCGTGGVGARRHAPAARCGRLSYTGHG